MTYVFDDGGRAAAGFAGRTSDCVVRSIAIVLRLSYREVYDMIVEAGSYERELAGRHKSSPRKGVRRSTIKKIMAEMDLTWTPTMGIGTGCRVHLRDGELPQGRLVVSVSKHLTAVVDGEIRDNHDPSRGGTRCVYGYWRAQ